MILLLWQYMFIQRYLLPSELDLVHYRIASEDLMACVMYLVLQAVEYPVQLKWQ